MEDLFKSGCHIIFCSDKKQKEEIVEKILNHDHNYKVEINEVFFAQKKIGPFLLKNKKTVWDIISKNEIINIYDVAYTIGEMKKIDIYYLDNRSSHALSNVQREIVSIFYEVLCGRNKLLLVDDDTKSKIQFINVVNWLSQMELFKSNNGSLIYITELSEDEFLNYMAQSSYNFLKSFNFYQTKNNQLVKSELKDNRTLATVIDIEIYDLLDFIEVTLLLERGKIKAGDQFLSLPNNKIIKTIGSIRVYDNDKEITKSEIDGSNTDFFIVTVPIEYKDDFDVYDEFIRC